MRTKHIGRRWFVDYRFVSGSLHNALRLLFCVLCKSVLKFWRSKLMQLRSVRGWSVRYETTSEIETPLWQMKCQPHVTRSWDVAFWQLIRVQHTNFFFFISLFLLQSFISSGDYDDEDDYPDLNERLESYKSEWMNIANVKTSALPLVKYFQFASSSCGYINSHKDRTTIFLGNKGTCEILPHATAAFSLSIFFFFSF